MASIATDTYDVVMTVDDSDSARAVNRQTAAARMLDAQWRSTMNSQIQAGRAAGDAMKTAPVEGFRDSVKDATSHVGRMAAQFVVMRGGMAMFESFRDSLAAMREHAAKTADEMFQIRDSMRDIMSIRGMTGPESEQVIRDHLQLVKETGMTSREAHDYTEQFLGSAEAFRGKMKPEDFEAFQRETARFALVQGGDVGMHAAIAGQMLMHARQGATAGELEAQQAEAYRLLNLGQGRTPLLGQAYGQAAARLVAPEGQAGGMVGDMRSLAVLAMGASRLGGEGAVDTKLEQFARAMTGNVGRGGAKWTEYLRGELGIREGITAEAAMPRVFGAMETAQAGGRDLATWLKEQGLADRGAQTALIGMFNQRRELTTEMNRQTQITPEAAQLSNQQAYASRVDLRSRLARSDVAVAEAERSMQGEEADILKRRGMAQAIKDRAVGTDYLSTRGVGDMVRDTFNKQVYGLEHDEMVAQQYGARIAERDASRGGMGVRFRRTATPWLSLRNVGLSLFGGAAGQTAALTQDEAAYAASNQFEADVNATRDSRIDPNNRMRSGPDAQMHSVGEIRDMLRRQGYTFEMIERYLRNDAAKPMAGGPRPAGRDRP